MSTAQVQVATPANSATLAEVLNLIQTADPKVKVDQGPKEKRNQYLSRLVQTILDRDSVVQDADYNRLSEAAKVWLTTSGREIEAHKDKARISEPPMGDEPAKTAGNGADASAPATSTDAAPAAPTTPVDPELAARAADARKILAEFNAKRREAEGKPPRKTPVRTTTTNAEPRKPKEGFVTTRAYEWLANNPNATFEDLVHHAQIEKPIAERTEPCGLSKTTLKLIYDVTKNFIGYAKNAGHWVD